MAIYIYWFYIASGMMLNKEYCFIDFPLPENDCSVMINENIVGGISMKINQIA